MGGASVPYNQTITTGLHNLYQSLEAVVPEPRFGFAWNIDSKTVMRGGIGSFATLFAGSVAASVFGNAPSVFKPSVTFGEAGPASDPASSAYAAAAAYKTFTSQFAGGGTLAAIKAALGRFPSRTQLLFAAEQLCGAEDYRVERGVGAVDLARMTSSPSHTPAIMATINRSAIPRLTSTWLWPATA